MSRYYYPLLVFNIYYIFLKQGIGKILKKLKHYKKILTTSIAISITSPEEFITFLYKNVLDRDPDPDGYNNWVSLIQSGMSKEDILLHFIDSDEFKDICKMFGLKA